MFVANEKKAEKPMKTGEKCLCGFICFIGIFAAGHVLGVLLDMSVTSCGNLILIMLGMGAVAAVLCVIMKRRNRKLNGQMLWKRKGFATDFSGRKLGAFVLFLVLAGMQLWLILGGEEIQTPGDITLETIHSFLESDGIYTISPLTGKPYAGPPFRYEILCLPTMYTLLCKWFGITPEVLTDKIVPMVILCMTYVAYDLLGRTLFGEKKESAEKRIWFLAAVAAVMLLSEKAVYMDGYGLLYGGHLGTTWRNNILVPFVISAAIERKWWQVAGCVLAELCIVWTFWGCGVCLVLGAGILAAELLGSFWVGRIRRKHHGS